MLYWIKLRRDKVLRPQRDQDGAELQPRDRIWNAIRRINQE
jgi:hypothetical protein